MHYFKIIVVVALCQLSLPLQATDKSHHHEVGEYLQVETSPMLGQKEAHDIITAANWENAKRIDILFDDDFYQPDELILEAGQAYILAIENVGGKRHDIAGEEFFANIVVNKIKHRGLTVSAYHVESIHVQADEKVELWMVAKSVGEFPFICTIPGHMHDGMEGMLTVTPKSAAVSAAKNQVIK